MSAERNIFTKITSLFNRKASREAPAESEHKERIVLDVNDGNWEAFLANPRAVLVLGAPGWCQPCQRYAPIIEELAKTFPDVKFGEVDLDKGHRIKAKKAYPHNVIPFTVLFRDGQDIGQSFFGVRSVEQASDHLRRFLLQPPSASQGKEIN